VFLRNEERGSRIIPLAQLRLEIEQLGESMPTWEERTRPPRVTESGQESPSSSGGSRRTRRSPGRSGDGSDPKS